MCVCVPSSDWLHLQFKCGLASSFMSVSSFFLFFFIFFFLPVWCLSSRLDYNEIIPPDIYADSKCEMGHTHTLCELCHVPCLGPATLWPSSAHSKLYGFVCHVPSPPLSIQLLAWCVVYLIVCFSFIRLRERG